MRYLFRGLIRDNGKPVEGHVEAPTEEEAYRALSENGIVTSSLRPDPRPLNLNRQPQAPQFADAIDSALDISSQRVAFDALTERYKGKQVWVIDRDKIRRRVADVVDSVLAQNLQTSASSDQTRERVAEAIRGMFGDNRNIASEASASQVALEQQIARLNSVVTQAEKVLASLTMAANRIGSGRPAGPRRLVRHIPNPLDEPRNEVLLEIFKTNLDLIRRIENEPALPRIRAPRPPAA